MQLECKNIVKAVILAGGKGKRLRPITDYMPKSMVPINNVPLIEWQINYLHSHQIIDIIICAGYKSDVLENFLGENQTGKFKVTISRETKPLGTAGAIKKIQSMIDEDMFFVLNGDVITNIDLARLAERPNSIAAIPLRTKFGVLTIHENKITKFGEKSNISDIWMNAGIYCLSRSALKDMPRIGDLEKTLFPHYANQNKLNTIKFNDAIWYSIDSFKDIEECASDIGTLV